MKAKSPSRPLYLGRITDQTLLVTNRDVTCLKLEVKVDYFLPQPQDSTGRITDICSQTVEVWLQFPEDNHRLNAWGRSDLRKLGFLDDDLEQLDPTHPSQQSLINQWVFLRLTKKETRDFWNLSWATKGLEIERAIVGTLNRRQLERNRKASTAPVDQEVGTSTREALS